MRLKGPSTTISGEASRRKIHNRRTHRQSAVPKSPAVTRYATDMATSTKLCLMMGCKVIELPNEPVVKSWELVKQAAMSVHFSHLCLNSLKMLL